MNAPQSPRCTLARFIPNQMDVEEVKPDGWNDHRILVVGADDTRINWMERQVIEQIGQRLYGRKTRRV